MDRHYAGVLRFFRSKAPASAADLAQKTFLACFESLGSLRDAASYRSFLYGIAFNVLRKHFRATRPSEVRVDFAILTAVDLDPSPSQLLAGQDERRILLEGLRRLPLNYQTVLELHYWEQMTAAEIAEGLELPLGTVKTWIRRGRIRLEKLISEFDGPSAALLKSTLSDLESWAGELRATLGRE